MAKVVRIFRNENPDLEGKVIVGAGVYYEKLTAWQWELLKKSFPDHHNYPQCNDGPAHSHQFPEQVAKELDFVVNSKLFMARGEEIVIRINANSSATVVYGYDDGFKETYLIAAFGDEEYIDKVNAAAVEIKEELSQISSSEKWYWEPPLLACIFIFAIGIIAASVVVLYKPKSRVGSPSIKETKTEVKTSVITYQDLKRGETKEFSLDWKFIYCDWNTIFPEWYSTVTTLRTRFGNVIERAEIKWRAQENGWDYVYCYLKTGKVYKAKMGVGAQGTENSEYIRIHYFKEVETF